MDFNLKTKVNKWSVQHENTEEYYNGFERLADQVDTPSVFKFPNFSINFFIKKYIKFLCFTIIIVLICSFSICLTFWKIRKLCSKQLFVYYIISLLLCSS